MTETTDNQTDPETVIRKYLLFLSDPSKLRDEAEIEQKRKAVDEAQDPIEQLRARTELELASNVDEKPLRDGFITHAKTWAEEQGILLVAFRQMKVPDDVLREAGFEVPGPKRRGRSNAAEGGEGRQRAKAVPVDEIKGYVLGLEGTFLLTDITNGIGGSPATVRKAVDECIEAGQVEKLGSVQDYQGRGRAPVEYRRK